MNDIRLYVNNLINKKRARKPNMQEPLIRKILDLAKSTFARNQSAHQYGSRHKVLQGEAFANKLNEITLLMKQVKFVDYSKSRHSFLFLDISRNLNLKQLILFRFQ